MSIYAVGDIQGCYQSLKKLLKKVQFDPDKDQLWSVGDLINRGPKNYDVIKFCMDLGDNFTGVLGNHDLHFLAVALGYSKARKADTFDDLLNAKELSDIVQWMRLQKLIHYDKDRKLAMVHAGIPPHWSISQSLKRASEIESVVRCDKKSSAFFETMYGNEPSKSTKSLSDTDRWRLTTNYFTRMRFCDTNGALELHSKGKIINAPKGYAPWFTQPERKAAGTRIVFGHWAALLGETNTPNTYALDTGCVWGERMTMVDIDNLDTRISVEAQEN